MNVSNFLKRITPNMGRACRDSTLVLVKFKKAEDQKVVIRLMAVVIF